MNHDFFHPKGLELLDPQKSGFLNVFFCNFLKYPETWLTKLLLAWDSGYGERQKLNQSLVFFWFCYLYAINVILCTILRFSKAVPMGELYKRKSQSLSFLVRLHLYFEHINFITETQSEKLAESLNHIWWSKSWPRNLDLLVEE